MKLRVAFTRQSNFDISDLDFLTEKFGDQPFPRRTTRSGRTPVGRKTPTDDKTPVGRRTPIYTGDYHTFDDYGQAPGDTTTDPQTNKTLASTANKVENRFIKMMERIGNSLSGFFNMLMGWLKGLPDLAKRILGKLKPLWEKIKAWGTKFHIFYRAKALSRATVACVGFIASMVASWIYSIIFGKNSKQADDRRSAASRLRGRMGKHMHLFAHPGMTKNSSAVAAIADKKVDKPVDKPVDEPVDTAETAVFIEAFGEILREDSNGGMFMAMAQTTIKRCKGTVTALKKACSNASAPLKNLTGKLYDAVFGSDATLASKSNELTAGTRFDDSLPALYESIIREAQAHKIKSIKKKAIKKVAMKKARAKKALKGRM